MSARDGYYPPVSSWGLDPAFHSYRKMLIGSLLTHVEVVAKQLYFEM